VRDDPCPVDDVCFELEEWSASPQAEARLQRHESSKQHCECTPATLAAQIVEQCEEIEKRHGNATLAEYVDDGVLR
jgi:hypothetical protein